MNARIERGKAIAASRQLREAPDGSWVVLSQSKPKTKYLVDLKEGTCSCPDFEAWELPCKHQYAAKFFQQEDLPDEGNDVMVRQTYQQDWPAYNEAQIREREHFELLLRDLCRGIEQPAQGLGRPRLPLADLIYAVTTKVYSGFSGRRASTDVRSCQSKGLIKKAPHHNSISKCLRQKGLTPMLKKLVQESAAPLHVVEKQFAADATGFSTSTYDRWHDHKWGQPIKKARWIKCHAMVGVKTNVVTAVEVTKGNVADTTQMPDLVLATAERFNVEEVSADKAYLSSQNLMTVEAIGAQPYVPFKSNSQGNGPEVWKRLWHLFWYRREDFLRHYHARSNVESTFSAIKRKFGGSVRSKNFESQVNEVLVKVLAFNITMLIHEMYGLGIDPTFEGGDDGFGGKVVH